MTRKDYILLAEVFRIYAPLKRSVVEILAEALADRLALDNPHFDREHFLAVVRGEKDLNSRPPRHIHPAHAAVTKFGQGQ